MSDDRPIELAPYVPVPEPGSRKPWVLPVVITAVVLFVAGIVFAAYTLVSALIAGPAGLPAPNQPLATGAPAEPVAVAPLDCDGACFAESSVGEFIVDLDAYREVGLDSTTQPWGAFEPVPAGQLYERDLDSWLTYDGTPDECFFVPTSAPYAPTIDARWGESTDLVHFVGTQEDRDRRDMSEQSLRLFTDTTAATAYLTAVSTALSGCDEIAIGPSSNRYAAAITAMPAFALPDSVAAVGWVRTGLPGVRWRAYTVDVQRGNAVTRIRLLTDGSITEQAFRELVEEYAIELAALEPDAAVSP